MPDPKTTAPPFNKPLHVANGVICCSKMIQLDNGEMLAPWYSYDVPKVFLSKDKDVTWKMLYAWPKIHSMFPEPSIAQLPSGRLACVVRYKDEHLHISFPDDNGRNWTPMRRTPMTSQHHRGRLTVLSTGELLCTYGWRCRGSEFPGHQAQDDLSTVQVAVRLDEDKIWPKELMRFIHNGILNWDTGYSDAFELPDGKLCSLYWTNRFKRYFVIGYTYERWF